MTVLANAAVFDGRALLPGRHDATPEGKRVAAVGPHTGAASGYVGTSCAHDIDARLEMAIAPADLIVVDGDPLADLSLLARPGEAA